jgi:predicted transcriptional regulator of viral defense system
MQDDVKVAALLSREGKGELRRVERASYVIFTPAHAHGALHEHDDMYL